MKKDIRPKCVICLDLGMWHCSDPLHCVGMQFPDEDSSQDTREIKHETTSDTEGSMP